MQKTKLDAMYLFDLNHLQNRYASHQVCLDKNHCVKFKVNTLTLMPLHIIISIQIHE